MPRVQSTLHDPVLPIRHTLKVANNEMRPRRGRVPVWSGKMVCGMLRVWILAVIFLAFSYFAKECPSRPSAQLWRRVHHLYPLQIPGSRSVCSGYPPGLVQRCSPVEAQKVFQERTLLVFAYANHASASGDEDKHQHYAKIEIPGLSTLPERVHATPSYDTSVDPFGRSVPLPRRVKSLDGVLQGKQPLTLRIPAAEPGTQNVSSASFVRPETKPPYNTSSASLAASLAPAEPSPGQVPLQVVLSCGPGPAKPVAGSWDRLESSVYSFVPRDSWLSDCVVEVRSESLSHSEVLSDTAERRSNTLASAVGTGHHEQKSMDEQTSGADQRGNTEPETPEDASAGRATGSRILQAYPTIPLRFTVTAVVSERSSSSSAGFWRPRIQNSSDPLSCAFEIPPDGKLRLLFTEEVDIRLLQDQPHSFVHVKKHEPGGTDAPLLISFSASSCPTRPSPEPHKDGRTPWGDVTVRRDEKAGTLCTVPSPDQATTQQPARDCRADATAPALVLAEEQHYLSHCVQLSFPVPLETDVLYRVVLVEGRRYNSFSGPYGYSWANDEYSFSRTKRSVPSAKNTGVGIRQQGNAKGIWAGSRSSLESLVREDVEMTLLTGIRSFRFYAASVAPSSALCDSPNRVFASSPFMTEGWMSDGPTARPSGKQLEAVKQKEDNAYRRGSREPEPPAVKKRYQRLLLEVPHGLGPSFDAAHFRQCLVLLSPRRPASPLAVVVRVAGRHSLEISADLQPGQQYLLRVRTNLCSNATTAPPKDAMGMPLKDSEIFFEMEPSRGSFVGMKGFVWMPLTSDIETQPAQRPLQLYAAFKEGSAPNVTKPQGGSGGKWIICLSPVDDLIVGALELTDNRGTHQSPHLPPTPAARSPDAYPSQDANPAVHFSRGGIGSGQVHNNNAVLANIGTQTPESLQPKLGMLLDALRASQPSVSIQAPLLVRPHSRLLSSEDIAVSPESEGRHLISLPMASGVGGGLPVLLVQWRRKLDRQLGALALPPQTETSGALVGVTSLGVSTSIVATYDTSHTRASGPKMLGCFPSSSTPEALHIPPVLAALDLRTSTCSVPPHLPGQHYSASDHQEVKTFEVMVDVFDLRTTRPIANARVEVLRLPPSFAGYQRTTGNSRGSDKHKQVEGMTSSLSSLGGVVSRKSLNAAGVWFTNTRGFVRLSLHQEVSPLDSLFFVVNAPNSGRSPAEAGHGRRVASPGGGATKPNTSQGTAAAREKPVESSRGSLSYSKSTGSEPGHRPPQMGWSSSNASRGSGDTYVGGPYFLPANSKRQQLGLENVAREKGERWMSHFYNKSMNAADKVSEKLVRLSMTQQQTQAVLRSDRPVYAPGDQMVIVGFIAVRGVDTCRIGSRHTGTHEASGDLSYTKPGSLRNAATERNQGLTEAFLCSPHEAISLASLATNTRREDQRRETETRSAESFERVQAGGPLYVLLTFRWSDEESRFSRTRRKHQSQSSLSSFQRASPVSHSASFPRSGLSRDSSRDSARDNQGVRETSEQPDGLSTSGGSHSHNITYPLMPTGQIPSREGTGEYHSGYSIEAGCTEHVVPLDSLGSFVAHIPVPQNAVHRLLETPHVRVVSPSLAMYLLNNGRGASTTSDSTAAAGSPAREGRQKTQSATMQPFSTTNIHSEKKSIQPSEPLPCLFSPRSPYFSQALVNRPDVLSAKVLSFPRPVLGSPRLARLQFARPLIVSPIVGPSGNLHVEGALTPLDPHDNEEGSSLPISPTVTLTLRMQKRDIVFAESRHAASRRSQSSEATARVGHEPKNNFKHGGDSSLHVEGLFAESFERVKADKHGPGKQSAATLVPDSCEPECDCLNSQDEAWTVHSLQDGVSVSYTQADKKFALRLTDQHIGLSGRFEATFNLGLLRFGCKEEVKESPGQVKSCICLERSLVLRVGSQVETFAESAGISGEVVRRVSASTVVGRLPVRLLPLTFSPLRILPGVPFIATAKVASLTSGTRAVGLLESEDFEIKMLLYRIGAGGRERKKTGDHVQTAAREFIWGQGLRGCPAGLVSEKDEEAGGGLDLLAMESRGDTTLIQACTAVRIAGASEVKSKNEGNERSCVLATPLDAHEYALVTELCIKPRAVETSDILAKAEAETLQGETGKPSSEEQPSVVTSKRSVPRQLSSTVPATEGKTDKGTKKLEKLRKAGVRLSGCLLDCLILQANEQTLEKRKVTVKVTTDKPTYGIGEEVVLSFLNPFGLHSAITPIRGVKPGTANKRVGANEKDGSFSGTHAHQINGTRQTQRSLQGRQRKDSTDVTAQEPLSQIADDARAEDSKAAGEDVELMSSGPSADGDGNASLSKRKAALLSSVKQRTASLPRSSKELNLDWGARLTVTWLTTKTVFITRRVPLRFPHSDMISPADTDSETNVFGKGTGAFRAYHLVGEDRMKALKASSAAEASALITVSAGPVPAECQRDVVCKLRLTFIPPLSEVPLSIASLELTPVRTREEAWDAVSTSHLGQNRTQHTVSVTPEEVLYQKSTKRNWLLAEHGPFYVDQEVSINIKQPDPPATHQLPGGALQITIGRAGPEDLLQGETSGQKSWDNSDITLEPGTSPQVSAATADTKNSTEPFDNGATVRITAKLDLSVLEKVLRQRRATNNTSPTVGPSDTPQSSAARSNNMRDVSPNDPAPPKAQEKQDWGAHQDPETSSTPGSRADVRDPAAGVNWQKHSKNLLESTTNYSPESPPSETEYSAAIHLIVMDTRLASLRRSESQAPSSIGKIFENGRTRIRQNFASGSIVVESRSYHSVSDLVSYRGILMTAKALSQQLAFDPWTTYDNWPLFPSEFFRSWKAADLSCNEDCMREKYRDTLTGSCEDNTPGANVGDYQAESISAARMEVLGTEVETAVDPGARVSSVSTQTRQFTAGASAVDDEESEADTLWDMGSVLRPDDGPFVAAYTIRVSRSVVESDSGREGEMPVTGNVTFTLPTVPESFVIKSFAVISGQTKSVVSQGPEPGRDTGETAVQEGRSPGLGLWYDTQELGFTQRPRSVSKVLSAPRFLRFGDQSELEVSVLTPNETEGETIGGCQPQFRSHFVTSTQHWSIIAGPLRLVPPDSPTFSASSVASGDTSLPSPLAPPETRRGQQREAPSRCRQVFRVGILAAAEGSPAVQEGVIAFRPVFCDLTSDTVESSRERGGVNEICRGKPTLLGQSLLIKVLILPRRYPVVVTSSQLVLPSNESSQETSRLRTAGEPDVRTQVSQGNSRAANDSTPVLPSTSSAESLADKLMEPTRLLSDEILQRAPDRGLGEPGVRQGDNSLKTTTHPNQPLSSEGHGRSPASSFREYAAAPSSVHHPQAHSDGTAAEVDGFEGHIVDQFLQVPKVFDTQEGGLLLGVQLGFLGGIELQVRRLIHSHKDALLCGRFAEPRHILESSALVTRPPPNVQEPPEKNTEAPPVGSGSGKQIAQQGGTSLRPSLRAMVPGHEADAHRSQRPSSRLGALGDCIEDAVSGALRLAPEMLPDSEVLLAIVLARHILLRHYKEETVNGNDGTRVYKGGGAVAGGIHSEVPHIEYASSSSEKTNSCQESITSSTWRDLDVAGRVAARLLPLYTTGLHPATRELSCAESTRLGLLRRPVAQYNWSRCSLSSSIAELSSPVSDLSLIAPPVAPDIPLLCQAARVFRVLSRRWIAAVPVTLLPESRMAFRAERDERALVKTISDQVTDAVSEYVRRRAYSWKQTELTDRNALPVTASGIAILNFIGIDTVAKIRYALGWDHKFGLPENLESRLGLDAVVQHIRTEIPPTCLEDPSSAGVDCQALLQMPSLRVAVSGAGMTQDGNADPTHTRTAGAHLSQGGSQNSGHRKALPSGVGALRSACSEHSSSSQEGRCLSLLQHRTRQLSMKLISREGRYGSVRSMKNREPFSAEVHSLLVILWSSLPPWALEHYGLLWPVVNALADSADGGPLHGIPPQNVEKGWLGDRVVGFPTNLCSTLEALGHWTDVHQHSGERERPVQMEISIAVMQEKAPPQWRLRQEEPGRWPSRHPDVSDYSGEVSQSEAIEVARVALCGTTSGSPAARSLTWKQLVDSRGATTAQPDLLHTNSTRVYRVRWVLEQLAIPVVTHLLATYRPPEVAFLGNGTGQSDRCTATVDGEASEYDLLPTCWPSGSNTMRRFVQIFDPRSVRCKGPFRVLSSAALGNDSPLTVAAAKVGEVYCVTLTLEVHEETRGIFVEDPLGGGFEFVDPAFFPGAVVLPADIPRLRSNSKADARRSARPGFFSSWFKRCALLPPTSLGISLLISSFQSQRIGASKEWASYLRYKCTRLPAGTHLLQYLMRAAVPGFFTVPPPVAYQVAPAYADSDLHGSAGSAYADMRKRFDRLLGHGNRSTITIQH